MTGDNETNEEEWVYGFQWNLSSDSVPIFYLTMKGSLDRWPGGNPAEQEILSELHKQAYQMLIERSFREG